MVIVATDHNHVTALNATSGAVIWDETLGPFVPLGNLPCGIGINDYGITSTPYIDLTTRTIYVESLSSNQTAVRPLHRAYAIALDNGMTEGRDGRVRHPDERPGASLPTTSTTGALSLSCKALFTFPTRA